MKELKKEDIKKYWIEYNGEYHYFVGKIRIANIYSVGDLWICGWSGFTNSCLSSLLNKEITHGYHNDLEHLKQLCEKQMDEFLNDMFAQRKVKFD